MMKLAGLVYEDEDEYLNVFTNKQTTKSKLEDLIIFSRAKGNLIIKELSQLIIKSLVYITDTKDVIGIRMEIILILLKIK